MIAFLILTTTAITNFIWAFANPSLALNIVNLTMICLKTLMDLKVFYWGFTSIITYKTNISKLSKIWLGFLIFIFVYQSLSLLLYYTQTVLSNPISIFMYLQTINEIYLIPFRELAMSLTLSEVC